MKTPHVLIIDDESTLSSSLSGVLTHHGYQTTRVHSKKELEEWKGNKKFDIALLDLRLPDGNGLDVMEKIKQENPGTQVIIMTGYGTIDLAVEATKKGAFHFITKPFNAGEILNLSAKALAQAELKNENARLKSFVKKHYRFESIIGHSPPVLHLIETIKKVASSSSTVLITGESGTGKELIAKSLHLNSEQHKGPFVAVHCGAIPKDLLESELFGHIKGSFTGAIKDRVGKFHKAQGGTLFLDEISTMEVATQVKLLRVLQEKEFQPVGSEHTLHSNARVIAASNEDLEASVHRGTFRKDLFYRLNVIPLYVTPLRQRTADIPLLITHFMKENRKTNRIKGINPEALQALMQYHWPGNIRELENLIERLCVLKHGDFVTRQDLPPHYLNPCKNTKTNFIPHTFDTSFDFYHVVETFENELILKALKKTKWNKNKAAQLLKLNRTTLLEKIKKKGLREHPVPSFI